MPCLSTKMISTMVDFPIITVYVVITYLSVRIKADVSLDMKVSLLMTVRTLLASAIVALCNCKNPECGIVISAESRIIGGENVESFYPWFVALTIKGKFSGTTVACGGTLISKKHILTAAHCYPKSKNVTNSERYNVIFDLQDRCLLGQGQRERVKKVDIHSEFNPITVIHDIALITLHSDVSYMPICLPKYKARPPKNGTIIGFGSIVEHKRYPCMLQEGQVQIYTHKECQYSKLAEMYSDLPGTLCAGRNNGGVDTCDGDSGGPLQTISKSDVFTIRGITSFGEGCAKPHLPGIYTDVAYYRKWIDARM